MNMLVYISRKTQFNYATAPKSSRQFQASQVSPSADPYPLKECEASPLPSYSVAENQGNSVIRPPAVTSLFKIAEALPEEV